MHFFAIWDFESIFHGSFWYHVDSLLDLSMVAIFWSCIYWSVDFWSREDRLAYQIGCYPEVHYFSWSWLGECVIYAFRTVGLLERILLKRGVCLIGQDIWVLPLEILNPLFVAHLFILFTHFLSIVWIFLEW